MSTNKPIWAKWEAELAKDFGGSLQVGSGSVWNKKGDVKCEDLLIEAKQTGKKSFSISLKLWEKISNEAIDNFRLPMLGLQIQDEKLVVLSKDDFLKIFIQSKVARPHTPDA